MGIERWQQVRCTAMKTSSKTGMRCGREAIAGTDRCENHPHGKHADSRSGYLSKFIRYTLRPTLAARIRASLEESPLVAQLDVSEELALMRESVNLRVGLFSELVEQAQTDKRITTENLIAAGQVMQAGLEDVVAMAQTMARIEALKAEVASGFASCMSAVITSVCRAAQRVFEDDHRVAELERVLREDLVARQSTADLGTTLTPSGLDETVLEMDHTVPALVGVTPTSAGTVSSTRDVMREMRPEDAATTARVLELPEEDLDCELG